MPQIPDTARPGVYLVLGIVLTLGAFILFCYAVTSVVTAITRA